MKRAGWVLAFLWFISMSSTAMAANWVQVAEEANYYVDTESAVLKDDYLYYWQVTQESDGGAHRVYYYRIAMSDPLYAHMVRGYLYAPNYKLQFQMARLGSVPVWSEGNHYRAIEIARRFAREGEPSPDTMPTLPWESK